jgi:hypothetical protein
MIRRPPQFPGSCSDNLDILSRLSANRDIQSAVVPYLTTNSAA